MGAGFVILVIGFLVLFFGLTFGTGWLAYSNNKKSSEGIFYPFSATVNPDGTFGTFTGLSATGETVNQIQCPLGTTVNIVGGISQVTDPFGMCMSPFGGPASPTLAGSVLAATCGMTGSVIPQPVSSGTACSDDSNCNGGFATGVMTCNASKQCELAVIDCNKSDCSTVCQARSNGIGAYQCVDAETGAPCSNSTSSGICVEANMCFSMTYPGQDPFNMLPNEMNPNGNSMCSPGGPGNCAVRDISAYLASQCDGQQTCNPSIQSLGPYPCSLTPMNCNFNLSTPQDYSPERLAGGNGFCALPFAYGNGSTVTVPGVGNMPNSSTPTASLGYTVHGIYTCV